MFLSAGHLQRRLAVLPLAAALSLVLPSGSQAARSPLAASHVLFGGTFPLVAQEPALGVKLGVVRMYDTLPRLDAGRAERLMAGGRGVIVSIDDHSGPSYAKLAAGSEDGVILPFLRSLAAAAVRYRVPLWMAFQHEANNPHLAVLGTPAQFQQAWDHLHALAAGAGLNVRQGGPIRWVLILMRWAYFTASERPRWANRLGYASGYWPGAGEADAVGADGYDMGGCKQSASDVPALPAVTPAYLFGPALAFARAQGVPLVVAEWGADWYSGDRGFQPAFISQMQSWVQQNASGLAAVSYFDGAHGAGSCAAQVDGHPASLAALAAMAEAMP
jgi:hypothetical protein